jgi:hypothetical protein
VTNNGRVVAMLVPPWSPLERLFLARLVTPPVVRRLPHIARVQTTRSTAEILDDLKGER